MYKVNLELKNGVQEEVEYDFFEDAHKFAVERWSTCEYNHVEITHTVTLDNIPTTETIWSRWIVKSKVCNLNLIKCYPEVN